MCDVIDGLPLFVVSGESVGKRYLKSCLRRVECGRRRVWIGLGAPDEVRGRNFTRVRYLRVATLDEDDHC